MRKLLMTSIWIYDNSKNRLLCTTLEKETEKAFGIMINRGHYVVKEQLLWIPKSICNIETNENYKLFNDQKEHEYCITHKVTLPDWFLRKNSIK